ncbi:UBX domain-containing protein 11 isoform X5 [Meriones unguiculatus]|uniref:UBX domain-containing protein 11 isoform X5 n=1 Tax=Meriones unguiculatus TaxID=10047 RepID=UPI00293E4788|nr:UBX domain-containing protein 11 isoform X5 [Meriones unguiculatus]
MRSAPVLVAWETPRQQDGGPAGRLAGPVEFLTASLETRAMSSPLASLSKTRKVPLEPEPINPGRRGIRIYGDENEVDMVNDAQDTEEKISIPSCYGGIGAPVGREALSILASNPGLDTRNFVHLTVLPFNDDLEPMSPLPGKLRDMENQLKVLNNELLAKDQKILALEELVQTLQEQQQQQQEQQEQQQQQGDSVVPPEVDFDRLLASLQDLSELVVEGESQVTPVPGGAQLRTLEPIPLKLYRNGIIMFDGPFRPFYDPTTQRCLRDILDGFFPSELQRLYPDGVPFKVSDLRNQVFPEDGLGPFPGEGRVVGRKMRKAMDRVEDPTGSRMTAEKFLNRLPKCVIRQGEVIDIRGPIRDTLQNCCPLPGRIQETVVETPALTSERRRSLESPSTPVPLHTMLRIKSENGEQAFLLMMRPEDTVGDVRKLLAHARGTDLATFEIFSTFPPTVYKDDTVTLKAAGLAPSATLLLRAPRVKASPSNLGLGPGPGPGPGPHPGPGSLS